MQVRNSKPPRRPFSQFLIETENTYLVLAGRAIQYFGLKEVISFLLGATAVFLYAFFTQSLPLVKISETTPPLETKTIALHGSVETLQGTPLKEFEVAIIDSRAGPFRSEDGTFTATVPLRKKYSILVWEPGYFPMTYYGDQDVMEQGGEYKLPLKAFPSNLGFVEGKVLDPKNRPITGFVEVAGKLTEIGSDGSFQLRNIPLGRVKLRVLRGPDGPQIYGKDIELSPAGLTPEDVTVQTLQ